MVAGSSAVGSQAPQTPVVLTIRPATRENQANDDDTFYVPVCKVARCNHQDGACIDRANQVAFRKAYIEALQAIGARIRACLQAGQTVSFNFPSTSESPTFQAVRNFFVPSGAGNTSPRSAASATSGSSTRAQVSTLSDLCRTPEWHYGDSQQKFLRVVRSFSSTSTSNTIDSVVRAAVFQGLFNTDYLVKGTSADFLLQPWKLGDYAEFKRRVDYFLEVIAERPNLDEKLREVIAFLRTLVAEMKNKIPLGRNRNTESVTALFAAGIKCFSGEHTVGLFWGEVNQVVSQAGFWERYVSGDLYQFCLTQQSQRKQQRSSDDAVLVTTTAVATPDASSMLLSSDDSFMHAYALGNLWDAVGDFLKNAWGNATKRASAFGEFTTVLTAHIQALKQLGCDFGSQSEPTELAKGLFVLQRLLSTMKDGKINNNRTRRRQVNQLVQKLKRLEEASVRGDTTISLMHSVSAELTEIKEQIEQEFFGSRNSQLRAFCEATIASIGVSERSASGGGSEAQNPFQTFFAQKLTATDERPRAETAISSASGSGSFSNLAVGDESRGRTDSSGSLDSTTSAATGALPASPRSTVSAPAAASNAGTLPVAVPQARQPARAAAASHASSPTNQSAEAARLASEILSRQEAVLQGSQDNALKAFWGSHVLASVSTDQIFDFSAAKRPGDLSGYLTGLGNVNAAQDDKFETLLHQVYLRHKLSALEAGFDTAIPQGVLKDFNTFCGTHGIPLSDGECIRLEAVKDFSLAECQRVLQKLQKPLGQDIDFLRAYTLAKFRLLRDAYGEALESDSEKAAIEAFLSGGVLLDGKLVSTENISDANEATCLRYLAQLDQALKGKPEALRLASLRACLKSNAGELREAYRQALGLSETVNRDAGLSSDELAISTPYTFGAIAHSYDSDDQSGAKTFTSRVSGLLAEALPVSTNATFAGFFRKKDLENVASLDEQKCRDLLKAVIATKEEVGGLKKFFLTTYFNSELRQLEEGLSENANADEIAAALSNIDFVESLAANIDEACYQKVVGFFQARAREFYAWICQGGVVSMPAMWDFIIKFYPGVQDAFGDFRLSVESWCNSLLSSAGVGRAQSEQEWQRLSALKSSLPMSRFAPASIFEASRAVPRLLADTQAFLDKKLDELLREALAVKDKQAYVRFQLRACELAEAYGVVKLKPHLPVSAQGFFTTCLAQANFFDERFLGSANGNGIGGITHFTPFTNLENAWAPYLALSNFFRFLGTQAQQGQLSLAEKHLAVMALWYGALPDNLRPELRLRYTPIEMVAPAHLTFALAGQHNQGRRLKCQEALMQQVGLSELKDALASEVSRERGAREDSNIAGLCSHAEKLQIALDRFFKESNSVDESDLAHKKIARRQFILWLLKKEDFELATECLDLFPGIFNDTTVASELNELKAVLLPGVVGEYLSTNEELSVSQKNLNVFVQKLGGKVNEELQMSAHCCSLLQRILSQLQKEDGVFASSTEFKVLLDSLKQSLWKLSSETLQRLVGLPAVISLLTSVGSLLRLTSTPRAFNDVVAALEVARSKSFAFRIEHIFVDDSFSKVSSSFRSADLLSQSPAAISMTAQGLVGFEQNSRRFFADFCGDISDSPQILLENLKHWFDGCLSGSMSGEGNLAVVMPLLRTSLFRYQKTVAANLSVEAWGQVVTLIKENKDAFAQAMSFSEFKRLAPQQAETIEKKMREISGLTDGNTLKKLCGLAFFDAKYDVIVERNAPVLCQLLQLRDLLFAQWREIVSEKIQAARYLPLLEGTLAWLNGVLAPCDAYIQAGYVTAPETSGAAAASSSGRSAAPAQDDFQAALYAYMTSPEKIADLRERALALKELKDDGVRFATAEVLAKELAMVLNLLKPSVEDEKNPLGLKQLGNKHFVSEIIRCLDQIKQPKASSANEEHVQWCTTLSAVKELAASFGIRSTPPSSPNRSPALSSPRTVPTTPPPTSTALRPGMDPGSSRPELPKVSGQAASSSAPFSLVQAGGTQEGAKKRLFGGDTPDEHQQQKPAVVVGGPSTR